MTDPENYGISEQAAREYDKAVQISREFSDLHEVQRIINWVLAQRSHIPNEDKFANVTSAMAAFTRAFHDLEATQVLCQVHCYTQGIALLRSVYEATGIGRTMALSISMKIADQWLRGKWQPDSKAREFVRNVMHADCETVDKEAFVASYSDTYSLLSKWAHITVDSALNPYVEDADSGYEFNLAPKFDEDFLVFTLNTTFVLAVYLAYAIRNSIGPSEVLGADWQDSLATLDVYKEKVKSVYVPQIKLYDQKMEKRRAILVESVRNSSEFRRYMS